MPRKKAQAAAVQKALEEIAKPYQKARPAPLACFVSDPHVGNHGRYSGPTVDGLNRRGRETVEVLRRAVAVAVDRGAGAFVVCGDLFQTARPEPAVIRAVQDVFAAAREHLRVILIPGNHDMPDATAEAGNTAMAPLWEVATIANVPMTIEVGGARLLAVPFDGRRPMAVHLDEVLRTFDHRGESKILATHVGVWSAADAAPWMLKARDGISSDNLALAMTHAGIETAFVGNYHEHRTWGFEGGIGAIVQVGTLCPASHSDGGLVDRGLVAFLEADGSWSKQEIPGPRFLTQNYGEEPPDPQPEGFSYYVRCRGFSVIDPAGAKGWTVAELEGTKPVEGDPEPVLREESDEEAIAAHVSEMDLAPTVDRDAVRDLALACWKRAS